FAHNINAAIVFGRSVTWHIQKDYKHRAGFDEWYEQEQQALRKNPLCRFFHEARTTISKVRLTAARRRFSLSLEGGVYLTEWLDAELFNVRPWYRRTLREHWQEVLRRVRKPVSALRVRLRRQVRTFKERLAARRSFGGSVNLWFDDPPWHESPAF